MCCSLGKASLQDAASYALLVASLREGGFTQSPGRTLTPAAGKPSGLSPKRVSDP